MAWRQGGEIPSGVCRIETAYRPDIGTGDVTYRQGGRPIKGVNQIAQPTVFEGNVFGLQWPAELDDHVAKFPALFQSKGGETSVCTHDEIARNTSLLEARFPEPTTTPAAYDALPLRGSWAKPGPVGELHRAQLIDGSTVTYVWYRFVDQPVFQQYSWSEEKRAQLQGLIESIHRDWPIDRQYLPPPSDGVLATLDRALLVTPPKGLEHGYVPVVVRQEARSNQAPVPVGTER